MLPARSNATVSFSLTGKKEHPYQAAFTLPSTINLPELNAARRVSLIAGEDGTTQVTYQFPTIDAYRTLLHGLQNKGCRFERIILTLTREAREAATAARGTYIC